MQKKKLTSKTKAITNPKKKPQTKLQKVVKKKVAATKINETKTSKKTIDTKKVKSTKKNSPTEKGKVIKKIAPAKKAKIVKKSTPAKKAAIVKKSTPAKKNKPIKKNKVAKKTTSIKKLPIQKNSSEEKIKISKGAKPKIEAIEKNKGKIITTQKQQEELKSLIAKGRDQGYLTFSEINDHLPPEIVDPDQIEDIIGMLNEDAGITICEETPEAETTIFTESTVQITEQQQTTTITTIEDETGRTSDPVRMYMREMGTVELLTRSGEIAIAKRIEEGSKNVLSAMTHYPGIIESVLSEHTKTDTGEKRLQDIISGFYDIEEWHTPPVDVKKITENDDDDDDDDDDKFTEELLAKALSDQAAKSAKKEEKEEKDSETDEAKTEGENDDENSKDTEKVEKKGAEVEATSDDSDDLDLFESGPDPVLAKKRFTKLHKLHRQHTKAAEKHGKTNETTTKVLKQLVDTFTQFKLTPKEFNKQTSKLRKVLTYIRHIEHTIMGLCVKKCKVPRKAFINSFPQHETDLKWIEKFAKTNKNQSKELLHYTKDIRREQKKLCAIETEVAL